MCFRVNRSADPSSDAHEALQVALASVAAHAPEVPAPSLTPVPWLADAWSVAFEEAHGWQNSFRGGSAPAHLKPLIEWLIVRGWTGEVSKMEMASMLPAVLLDVQPGERVLDLCAAPGSKASQLLDALEGRGRPQGCDERLSESLLVCNEPVADRAQRLCQRLRQQPSSRLLLLSCDAAQFPELRVAERPSCRRSTVQPIRYHKILCDVPCSGDGTLRKNPDIWETWSTGRGRGLHAKQLAILQRGLALLEPGGHLVYSTCSLNPLENEAVVAEALRGAAQTSGDVHLVEPPPLTGLAAVPGMAWWDAEGAEPSESGRQSWLPPTAAEAERFRLDRCLRLLPHRAGSGGFFCALFRKQAGDAAPCPVPAAEAPGEPRAERPAAPGKKRAALVQNAFEAVAQDSATAREVIEFFGLKVSAAEAEEHGVDRFPWELVAAPQKGPRLLLLLPSAALRGLQARHRLRTVAAGLPLFMHAAGDGRGAWPVDAPWKPCHEATALLTRCASRRVLRLPAPALVQLLRCPKARITAEDAEFEAVAPFLAGLDSGALLLAPARESAGGEPPAWARGALAVLEAAETEQVALRFLTQPNVRHRMVQWYGPGTEAGADASAR